MQHDVFEGDMVVVKISDQSCCMCFECCDVSTVELKLLKAGKKVFGLKRRNFLDSDLARIEDFFD